MRRRVASLACVLASLAGYGCALPAPVEPVSFAVDDAQLREAQLKERVDAAADRMRDDPQLHLLLVGHADEDNTEAYNEQLALRRAKEVRTSMLERHPSLEARIEAEGRGEWDPRVSGDDDAAKAENRRVEFVFFYPRQCEASWSESFADCLLGRIEPEPEPEPEPLPVPEPPSEPEAPDVRPRVVDAPSYKGLYGFVGVGWSVSTFDIPRSHLPYGLMSGYVWAPTKNLRLSAGGQVDHQAYLGFLFSSDRPQCQDQCAAPLHIVRVMPEGRIGGRAGRLWAHIRAFGGPAILIRPEHTQPLAGGLTETFPRTASVRPNLGLGPGFTFSLGDRLMLSLDFEVSFDGRFDDGAGIFGGKLSLGSFMRKQQ